MKTTSTRIRLLIALAAVLLASATVSASAQLARTQYATASITPTMTTAITNVNLGSLTGGAASTQTFDNVIAFTTLSGTHTVSAAMTVNATLWASVVVYVSNSGGQQCQLQGGSAISSIASCTWSITGNVSYNEEWVVTPNNGYSISATKIPITFSLA